MGSLNQRYGLTGKCRFGEVIHTSAMEKQKITGRKDKLVAVFFIKNVHTWPQTHRVVGQSSGKPLESNTKKKEDQTHIQDVTPKCLQNTPQLGRLIYRFYCHGWILSLQNPPEQSMWFCVWERGWVILKTPTVLEREANAVQNACEVPVKSVDSLSAWKGQSATRGYVPMSVILPDKKLAVRKWKDNVGQRP